ncbi:AMP-binding protein [Nocardia sp. NPDC005366]|uniref:AMP-binding protein n=1 Tax=Nocardia sp. NPDC005366 TaxID=3156878 RepID=UPI0033BD4B9F
MTDGLWAWATRRPAHVAVINPDGSTITAGELAQRANRFSHLLRSRGVAPHSRIALLVGNRHEFFELALGAQQIGVHPVPINTHLAPDEIAHIVSDCDAGLVIIEATFTETGLAALDAIDYPADRRVVLGSPDAPAARHYEQLLDAYASTAPTQRIWSNVMLYTSGTTGRPKGVTFPMSSVPVLPEEGLAGTEPMMIRRGMSTDPDGVTLVTGPLYHGAPGTWGLQGLHNGHTVVLAGSWDSERVLGLIEMYGVTTTQMAPIHFHRLLQLPENVRSRYGHERLRVVSHAGAPCPVETKRAMMDWWGPVLYEYFASSEGFGTSITAQEWLAHPGSVGHVNADGAEMTVLDENGQELPHGAIGTLWIRNPRGILSEYLNDEAKTRSSQRDGFYTAGDQAYIDAEGWLYIADRRTDMILSGGVNIYPAEVERALISHPAVAEVAVVGLPDPEWGKRVHAVVVTESGTADGEGLAEELRAHAARTLARFKLFRTIEFRQALPYSPTGKLLRRVIVAEHDG